MWPSTARHWQSWRSTTSDFLIKLLGWVLLRRAGLSQEQRQLIQGRAPDFAQRAVTEAMYFLLRQDFKGQSADRTWRGKSYGSTNRWSARHHGYITEDVYEAQDDDALYEDYEDAEWDESWDDTYYEDDTNEEQTYNAHDEFDIPDKTYLEAEQHYEDAFATYLDARRQMAHLKASRGFFPVVALTDGGGSITGSTMSQAPRSPKSKGRGKSKTKGKSKNKTSTWVNKGGQIPQRASATRCLKCGQVGHWVAHCPQNASPKSTSATRQSPSSSPTSTSPAKKAKSNDGSAMNGARYMACHGWHGLQDGGASSVVCGHDVLMRIVDYMCGRGLSADRFLHAHQQDFWFWRRRFKTGKLVCLLAALHWREDWLHGMLCGRGQHAPFGREAHPPGLEAQDGL